MNEKEAFLSLHLPLLGTTGESFERAPAQSNLDQLQDKQGQTAGYISKLHHLRRQKRDTLANQPGKPGGERERMRRCEGAEVGERGSRLDSLVRSVEEERDFYRQEAERLRRMMMKPSRSTNGPRGPRTMSPSQQPTSKGGTYDSEQKRLQRERDDLQALLNKYELHLSEIQANVRVLSADRDKTSVQYQKAQEEIAHLRRELMKSKLPRARTKEFTDASEHPEARGVGA
ncbi:hypothetical protein GJAV_G00213340 [Gymnothorax javanicus]|nr:hypothetical protein GJAV_G00213340 [Gymnothorax javanicus]